MKEAEATASGMQAYLDIISLFRDKCNSVQSGIIISSLFRDIYNQDKYLFILSLLTYLWMGYDRYISSIHDHIFLAKSLVLIDECFHDQIII